VRTLRGGVLAVAAGFGLALLAVSVFHTTAVGNCASGPAPYPISNPCPSNEGYWIGALFGSIAVSAIALSLLRRGLTTGAIFIAVGGACVAALATGAAHSSWLVAAIVLAGVFLPLGGAMLWLGVWAQSSRPTLLRTSALLPPAVLGAVAAVAVALAIPGPLR